MEMDREILPSSLFEDLSDDEDDEEREGDKEEKRRMDEYQKMVKVCPLIKMTLERIFTKLRPVALWWQEVAIK